RLVQPVRGFRAPRSRPYGAHPMKDLIERLERAEGPARELDGRIWCAVNGYEILGWDDDGCQYRAKQPGWISSYYIREWTASLDAALTLVPEGWFVDQISQANRAAGERPWACSLWSPTRPAGFCLVQSGKHETAA